MRSKFQEKILRVLYKVLKPLTHLLLEIGIGHREFSEIAKQAYVDVATERYGIRGRKTNISRVAVMTGLTRKEVKRIRDNSENGASAGSVRPIPALTVLYKWHSDDSFTDDSGAPLPLSFDTGEQSFQALVKKYAGDIPPGALRTELVRAGAVEIAGDGSLIAVRRHFRVVEGEARIERGIERLIGSITANVASNCLDRPEGSGIAYGWPDYLVELADVDPAKLPEIKVIARENLLRFAESIDSQLESFDRTATSNTDSKSVFVGLYYSELDN